MASNKNMENTFRVPSWGKALSEEDFISVQEQYGILADDLRKLADQIEQADEIFLNETDPDDNPIGIYFGERLYSQYGNGCDNGDISPQQSKDTVSPVMRILFSATQLKPEIEIVTTSPESAKQFYFDLINALRYVEHIPTSYSSGDTVVNGTYAGDYLKPCDPDNPPKSLLNKTKRKWLYMGAERKDGPKTKGLIDKLNDWQLKLRKIERSGLLTTPVLEFFQGQVLYDSNDLNISGGILEVLKKLHDNIGRVVPRVSLEGINTKAFHHIGTLRKLFEDNNIPLQIHTIPGEGYKLGRS